MTSGRSLLCRIRRLAATLAALATAMGFATIAPLQSTSLAAAASAAQGYWLVAADGGIFSFGDASFYGSMAGTHLNAPVVGMAATPDGHGYWLVAADGGIFTFGDAGFYQANSAGYYSCIPTPAISCPPPPTTAMIASPDGKGYGELSAAGSVGGWGDFDSQLSQCYGGYVGHLNKPAVALSYTPDKKGYWIFAADGGVFSFCDANFYGSTAGTHLNAPVVGGVGVP
jgi:hypothetical protein